MTRVRGVGLNLAVCRASVVDGDAAAKAM